MDDFTQPKVTGADDMPEIPGPWVPKKAWLVSRGTIELINTVVYSTLMLCQEFYAGTMSQIRLVQDQLRARWRLLLKMRRDCALFYGLMTTGKLAKDNT